MSRLVIRRVFGQLKGLQRIFECLSHAFLLPYFRFLTQAQLLASKRRSSTLMLSGFHTDMSFSHLQPVSSEHVDPEEVVSLARPSLKTAPFLTDIWQFVCLSLIFDKSSFAWSPPSRSCGHPDVAWLWVCLRLRGFRGFCRHFYGFCKYGKHIYVHCE